jgi:hypothetical protein
MFFTSRILCLAAVSAILSLASLPAEHQNIWSKTIGTELDRTKAHKAEMGEKNTFTLFYGQDCLTVIFNGKLEKIGKFNSNDYLMIVLSRNDTTKEVLFVPKTNADLAEEYMTFVISTDLFRELCEYFDTMHWWHG